MTAGGRSQKLGRVSTRFGALEPRELWRHSGPHAVVVPVLVGGLALSTVIALAEQMTWPCVVLLAYGVLVGVIATRARGRATRAGHDKQLEADLRDTILQLRRSRARVAHASDTERRRIERDLHDGCQQRLIAMRVKLSLADELAGDEHTSFGDLIKEIASDAESAIEDLHALVHGIYPALLTDRGLSDAVKAMGRAAPVSTRVLAQGVGRYRPDVEAAVYFTCAEALQNTAKHGGSGATARIVMRHETDGLAFEVRDDGVGFDPALRTGSGLANMEDRLGAVGGRVHVVSAPGCGTVVQGWVPAAALVS
jgi:signal transduction histidine kinase